MRKKREKERKYRLYVRLWWALIVGGVLLIALIELLTGLGLFGKLPAVEVLENPKSNLASEVYTADQVLLGKYFRENRTNVAYNEISPHVIDALISTEDERFAEHSGIDLKALFRALAYLGKRGGASTITQQLSKMLFHERPGSKIGRIIQKMQEWIIAVQLEKRYTKEEIIAMYLNRFDFINNAVGIKSASLVYFNKPPDSLRIEEAAMLVGMCKNPALFNPLKRMDTVMYRRNVVLNQLKRNGHIKAAECDSLKQLPIKLDYQRVDHKEGLAPYFREVLRSELKKIFSEKDEATGKLKIAKPDGSPYNIYTDGLKVYTTINSRMQRYAEWAVKEHLGGELQKDFWRTLKKKRNNPFDYRMTKKQINAIMMQAVKRTSRYRILKGIECGNCGRRGKNISETEEGGQKYYVCSAEECSDYRQAVLPEDSIMAVFNKPVHMRVFSWKGEIDTLLSPMDSIRYYKSFLQAGFMSMDPSTGFIKAWVGGIDFAHFSFDHVKQSHRQVGSTFKPFVYTLAVQQYPPCYEVPNVKTCFDLPDKRVWCPKNSDGKYGGMVSLKYGLANSVNAVTAWVMKQFGPKAVINLVRKMGIESPLDPVPSLCLGVADLSVYEMVGALSTFANKGVWLQPVFISRIEDKNRNVIYDYRERQNREEPMSEKTAFTMLQMLRAVADGAYNRETGKKTGTGMRVKFGSRPYGGYLYPIACKTGTTQNNSDGWFIGITPDLVSGCWVGAEDRAVHFTRTYYGQGANMALPIWGYYMKKVVADNALHFNTGDFEKPDESSDVEMNCKKYFKEQQGGVDFGGSSVNFNIE